MTKTLEDKVDMILELLVDLLENKFTYSLRAWLVEEGFTELNLEVNKNE